MAGPCLSILTLQGSFVHEVTTMEHLAEYHQIQSQNTKRVHQ